MRKTLKIRARHICIFYLTLTGSKISIPNNEVTAAESERLIICRSLIGSTNTAGNEKYIVYDVLLYQCWSIYGHSRRSR